MLITYDNARRTSFEAGLQDTCPLLSMSASDARAYLLESTSYFNLELPPYFSFDSLLRDTTQILDERPLASVSGKPQLLPSVNYTIYSNKNGKYAWRPFELMHPAIYVQLVNSLTSPEAWNTIQSRFELFSANPRICCVSLPEKIETDESSRGTQLRKWWEEIEQTSIRLALDFRHVFQADISNCYGSMYTHSIAWALHSIGTAKENKQDKSLLGNIVDKALRDMHHGQTNGIPQGSVLSDLLAELILGFADVELSNALEGEKVHEYQILRYRDDYRIFVNHPQDGEKILRALAEVLTKLGLRLHDTKTKTAQDVIPSSIKRDKLAWMGSVQHGDTLQKDLILIHGHAKAFPNAGSTMRALDLFCNRLAETNPVRHAIELISITVDIAFNNPRCFPTCTTIISNLLNTLENESDKLSVLNRIKNKLDNLPNNGHLEVWQQRMSYCVNKAIQYKEGLCRVVNEETISLWNNDWITDKELRHEITPRKIVDRERLNTMSSEVSRSEWSLFSPYF